MDRMNTERFHMMEAHPLYRLNEAIDRLQEEHVVLESDLLELYGMARAIGMNEDATNWSGALNDLNAKAEAYLRALDKHSEWEEHELFPMAGEYFEGGPEAFYEIEQEHVLAKQFVEAFVKAAGKMIPPVGRQAAKDMASYLLQAYTILNGHFRKEEELLIALEDRSNAYGY